MDMSCSKETDSFSNDERMAEIPTNENGTTDLNGLNQKEVTLSDPKSSKDCEVEENGGSQVDVLDVNKLCGLLQCSKSAGDAIAGKHVMLLIGGTGAGKTTTALYLAGASFREVEIDGMDHYEPFDLPNPELSQFAVSGGASSVTKTIHAATATLPDGETITICDTPGFGDTKGVETEISNGLGIIHALKRAASVKPVLVFNYEGMSELRYYSLRKTLSTVIEMMGPRKDFSPFEYVFTRCEGKNAKRVHQRLLGLQKKLKEEPKDILADDACDVDVFDLLISDMIQKTKPVAIGINPTDAEDPPVILKSLWSDNQERMTNPAGDFVDFVSQESLHKLNLQLQVFLERIDTTLKEERFTDAKTALKQLIQLSEALPLREVAEAVERGKRKGQNFVDQARSAVHSLRDRMQACGLTADAGTFRLLRLEMRKKLILSTQLQDIGCICGLAREVSLNTLIDNTFKALFAATQSLVPRIDESSHFPESRDALQGVFFRLEQLVDLLRDLVETYELESESLALAEAASAPIKAVLLSVEKELQDPNASALKEHHARILFLLEMHHFFSTNMVSGVNSSWWSWLETGLSALLGCLARKCDEYENKLNETAESIENLPEGKQAEPLTLPLDLRSGLKEGRSFLVFLSSSIHLQKAVCKESRGPALSVKRFDHVLKLHLSSTAESIQQTAQNLFDEDNASKSKEVLSSNIKDAELLLASSETTRSLCVELRDCSPDDLDRIEKDLFGTQEKLKLLIGVLHKEKSQVKVLKESAIRRPKQLAPSAEELAQAGSRQAKASLERWYAMLVELRAFRIRYGHFNVPRNDAKMKKLSSWVKNQRAAKKSYERGLKTDMTPDKLRNLEAIGFPWKSTWLDDVWNRRLNELKRYKEENGHCRFKNKDSGLGFWVKDIRRQYVAWREGRSQYRFGNSNGQRVRLTEERVDKLQPTGIFDDLNRPS